MHAHPHTDKKNMAKILNEECKHKHIYIEIISHISTIACCFHAIWLLIQHKFTQTNQNIDGGEKSQTKYLDFRIDSYIFLRACKKTF